MLDLQIQPEQFLMLDNDKTRFRVFVYIAAQNFTASETLDFKKGPNGLWMYRYTIYRQNTKSEYAIARKKNKAPIPEFLEAVDWSSDANAAVPTKVKPTDWN